MERGHETLEKKYSDSLRKARGKFWLFSGCSIDPTPFLILRKSSGKLHLS